MLWDGVLFLEADAPTPPQRFLARGHRSQQNAIVAHLRGALDSSRAYQPVPDPAVSDSLSHSVSGLDGRSLSHRFSVSPHRRSSQ